MTKSRGLRSRVCSLNDLLARCIAEGECLVWTGYRERYGIVRFGGRSQKAHRVAWLLARGPIPDGLVVMHTCDNPPCVNVEHLHLGTQAENITDMYQKGRARFATTTIQAQRNKAKTHCIRNHELSGGNLYIKSNGYRSCRACQKLYPCRVKQVDHA